MLSIPDLYYCSFTRDTYADIGYLSRFSVYREDACTEWTCCTAYTDGLLQYYLDHYVILMCNALNLILYRL